MGSFCQKIGAVIFAGRAQRVGRNRFIAPTDFQNPPRPGLVRSGAIKQLRPTRIRAAPFSALARPFAVVKPLVRRARSASPSLPVLARTYLFCFAKKCLRPGGLCGNQHHLIERSIVFHSVGSFCQKRKQLPPVAGTRSIALTRVHVIASQKRLVAWPPRSRTVFSHL